MKYEEESYPCTVADLNFATASKKTRRHGLKHPRASHHATQESKRNKVHHSAHLHLLLDPRAALPALYCSSLSGCYFHEFTYRLIGYMYNASRQRALKRE